MAAQVLDDLQDEDIGFGLVDEKKDLAVAKKLGELCGHQEKKDILAKRKQHSWQMCPEKADRQTYTWIDLDMFLKH